MRLIVPILLNCVITAGFYLLDKYTAFKKLPYIVKQVFIGILFGGLSAFASSYGVALLGTNVNVRDAAPLTAGLIFGSPAGIISGIIGGLYRWFSVYWGAGVYTQLACTIATIFAGFMAAGLRRFMFDSKKTTWGYGVCIAVVCEVIHMLLIFITNMNDSSYAFEFVRGASVPMIIGNALAVGVSIALVSIMSKEPFFRKRSSENIAYTFQRWLLFCIIIAFLATSAFTYFLQNGMVKIETQEIFTTAIIDVKTDIRGKSDEQLLDITQDIALIYKDNPEISLNTLAKEKGVTEINIVEADGLIVNSTDDGLKGIFNMNSTAQSKEFMVLVDKQETYVQAYGPVGSDGVTMRKFAGVSLGDGNYIQVGYSSEQFHEKINEFVFDVTKNRHVGSNGFVAVCDENLNMVTQTDRNGHHISTIGIYPNDDMQNGRSAKELCKATIVNNDNNFSRDYVYAFTFAEGYCIIAAMPETEVVFMRDVSIYNSVFMQILIFATLFVFIYILIKRLIINNIKKINCSLAQITKGNLNVTVDVRTNVEFASLSDDINSTVETLKNYIAEAAARIDRELEYAKQIQLSALPAKFPANDKYSIYAQMIAAKEVGGDFYDFYNINDNTIAFLVADVSGKGIPAAMFMMTAKTIIKDLAESGLEVNEIFTRANEKLCENNDSGMFVTAWMGILNTETGLLKFANAGHNPPLLKKKDGSVEFLRSRASLVLAGMEGVCYRVNEVQLSKGDRLFLYTDGVTEATNTTEKLFSEERLIEYMSKNSNLSAVDLLHGLKANIDEFVGEAPQFDDITMLVFDYLFDNNKGGIIMESKTFPAKTDMLTNVLGFVEESLEGFGSSVKTTAAVCVAIEELFVNIANYAYDGKAGDVEFSIGFDENSRVVTLKIADSGIPFNPLQKDDPDITLSAEERPIGGLGIFIVKKTMDSIEYSYAEGKNILTMTKKI